MPTADPQGPPCETLQSITGDENLLILVAAPGDESLLCGGLIAQSCARGRPPVVVVLADASRFNPASLPLAPDQLAMLRAQETRLASRRLGLPDGRLLLAGLHDSTIPDRGSTFDRVVEALILVMWARDCNVVCAPFQQDAAGDTHATHRIAAEIAARSGVGHVAITDREAPDCRRLDIRPQLDAKSHAIAAHMTQRDIPATPATEAASIASSLRPFEIFLVPSPPG